MLKYFSIFFRNFNLGRFYLLFFTLAYVRTFNFCAFSVLRMRGTCSTAATVTPPSTFATVPTRRAKSSSGNSKWWRRRRKIVDAVFLRQAFEFYSLKTFPYVVRSSFFFVLFFLLFKGDFKRWFKILELMKSSIYSKSRYYVIHSLVWSILFWILLVSFIRSSNYVK